MKPSELIEQAGAADDIRGLAILLFDHISTQINRADTKAGLILAADTLFATTIAALNRGIVLNLFDPATALVNRIMALAMLVMFAALLVSAFLALVVARPVLPTGNGHTLFYFGQIARLKAQDCLTRFACQSPDEIRSALLTDSHEQAQIANNKFVRVRSSLDFLIAALTLWAFIQIMMAVTP